MKILVFVNGMTLSEQLNIAVNHKSLRAGRSKQSGLAETS